MKVILPALLLGMSALCYAQSFEDIDLEVARELRQRPAGDTTGARVVPPARLGEVVTTGSARRR